MSREVEQRASRLSHRYAELLRDLGLQQLGGPVNRHPRPVAPVVGDTYVDASLGPVEAPERGRAVMAEDGPGPGGSDSSQPTAELGEVVVPDGVDATVDAQQSALAHPGSDGAFAQAKPPELGPTDHTVLASKQSGQPDVE